MPTDRVEGFLLDRGFQVLQTAYPGLLHPQPQHDLCGPLAAYIVERRGGILIHDSIIAREYGNPRVTGVPQATMLIHP